MRWDEVRKVAFPSMCIFQGFVECNSISAALRSWGRGQEVGEVVDRVQHPDSLVGKTYWQSGGAGPKASKPSPWRQEAEAGVWGVEVICSNVDGSLGEAGEENVCQGEQRWWGWTEELLCLLLLSFSLHSELCWHIIAKLDDNGVNYGAGFECVVPLLFPQ